MLHLQRNPGCKFRLHLDFHPVLIQGSQYLECRQHLGHDSPQGYACKVLAGTRASTESKCDGFDLARFEQTVVVEESLGHESVWVGVSGFVTRHRPGEVDHKNVSGKRVNHTNHTFVKNMAPEIRYQSKLGRCKKLLLNYPSEYGTHYTRRRPKQHGERLRDSRDQQQDLTKGREFSQRGVTGLYLSVSQ